MKVIITFTFCCDNLWKSKFMAVEKPGKLGIFFSYFVATLIVCVCVGKTIFQYRIVLHQILVMYTVFSMF